MAIDTATITVNGGLPDGTPLLGRWIVGLTSPSGLIVDTKNLEDDAGGFRGHYATFTIRKLGETITLPKTGAGTPSGTQYWATLIEENTGAVIVPKFVFTLTANTNMATLIATGVGPVPGNTKGDLIVIDANGVPQRLAAGPNNAFLVPDSTKPLGVRWSETLYIEGTGDPNGRFTAPRGSVFVNTESGGHNGAYRWRKDSAGNSSSGWVVVDGDTDLIAYQHKLINGWVAHRVYVRRTPYVVEWIFFGLDGSSASSSTLMSGVTRSLLPRSGGLLLNLGNFPIRYRSFEQDLNYDRNNPRVGDQYNSWSVSFFPPPGSWPSTLSP